MAEIVSVEEFKRSLRLTDTGDAEQDKLTDAILDGYLAGAESYIQDAVGLELPTFFEDNKATYKIAVYSLATAYYQNPSALTGNNVVRVDLVLNALIAQLRGRYEVALRKKGDADGSN